MKQWMITLLLLLATTPGWAQETLFNVPNSERTEVGNHYAQLQDSLDFPDHSLNLTYVYGLVENFEVGLNLFDINNLSTDEGGNSVEALVNAQWFTYLAEDFTLSLGTQLGRAQGGDFAAYGYLNLRLDLYEEAFLIAGLFTANEAYLEEKSGFWHIGCEFPVGGGFALEAEYINGSSPMSNGIVGLAYKAGDHWELTVGAQLPSLQSGNDPGVVFEITHL